MAEQEAKVEPGQAAQSQPTDPGQGTPENMVSRDELKKVIAERDEMKSKMRAFEKQFGTIEAEKKAAEIKALEQSGEYEKALASRESEWKAKQDAIQGKFAKIAIDGAITAAAAKMRASNPGDVALMLRSAFKLDPETHEPTPDLEALKLLGIDPKDDRLQAKSLTQIVEEVLKSRPHLMSPVAPGGGNGTQSGAAVTAPTKPTNMYSDDAARAEYLKALFEQSKG